MAPCEHVEGHRHDCSYVDWRDSLIPKAEKLAHEEHPEPANAGRLEWRAWTRRWDAAYHRAMARLTSDPFALSGIAHGASDIFDGSADINARIPGDPRWN